MNESDLEWRWFAMGVGETDGLWMRVRDGSGWATDAYGRTYEQAEGLKETNDG